jgi:hypothetical protein
LIASYLVYLLSRVNAFVSLFHAPIISIQGVPSYYWICHLITGFGKSTYTFWKNACSEIGQGVLQGSSSTVPIHRT